MLGLEWKDVDFKNNIISVRRTSNYTAKKGVYTDTTKTRKSQRTLKFPQEIMDMLKEYKSEQDEQALKCGDKWVETDRLYVKWNGEPMQNGTPYFWLSEFCEKHDLPFYGLHSFRHINPMKTSLSTHKNKNNMFPCQKPRYPFEYRGFF